MRRFSFLAATTLLASGCATGTSSSSEDVTVYFVGDSPRGFVLFSETRPFELSERDSTQAVLSALMSGEIQPHDPDYVNLWDASHAVHSLTISGDGAILDLSFGKLNVGAEAEARAFDQVLWTLHGLQPSVDELTILVDGEPIESLAGHVDVTGPFALSDPTQVLTPVQISSPFHGQTVPQPVVVEGEACTFEANVLWELRNSSGVVDQGFTSAERACPERSAWRVDLGSPPPGKYVFRVYELSAEDGTVVAEDTKEFVVE